MVYSPELFLSPVVITTSVTGASQSQKLSDRWRAIATPQGHCQMITRVEEKDRYFVRSRDGTAVDHGGVEISISRLNAIPGCINLPSPPGVKISSTHYRCLIVPDGYQAELRINPVRRLFLVPFSAFPSRHLRKLPRDRPHMQPTYVGTDSLAYEHIQAWIARIGSFHYDYYVTSTH